VEFTTPMPPNKPKIEAPAPNESSTSDYCRFAQTTLSIPLMEGFDADFDVGVEQVDGTQVLSLFLSLVLIFTIFLQFV